MKGFFFVISEIYNATTNFDKPDLRFAALLS